LSRTLAAAGLALTGSGGAHVAEPERVDGYYVDVAVHRDGTAHVREQITYDFGTAAKHGIERDIRYSEPTGGRRNRLIDVSGIKVSSPDAPARTRHADDGTYKDIRVGDPNRTITGIRQYVIEYDTNHVAIKTGAAGYGVRPRNGPCASAWCRSSCSRGSTG